jgi:hypothetical protein
MGIQTSDKYIHTWCDKCETIQKVSKVKHHLDEDKKVFLIGCPNCRSIKINQILSDLI